MPNPRGGLAPQGNRWFPVILTLLCFVALSGCRTLPPNSLAHHNSSKWQGEIKALLAQDQTNPPPARPIVFTGSSSIRLWQTLAADFPDCPVLNRGFGGCQLADVVNYADRVVIPYRPRQVVIYCGGNDINAGKAPDLVYGDFVALVERLQSALPGVRLAYIASAPNPARWAEVERVRRLNRLVEEYCRKHRLDFIDVFPLMLGADGQPRPELFVADRLHMNATGYALWKTAVRPYLHCAEP